MQKCKVVSLNLAHLVYRVLNACLYIELITTQCANVRPLA